MEFETLLAELEAKCKKHDWTYHFTDDPSVWNKGKSSANAIDSILAQMKIIDGERAKKEYIRLRVAHDPLMKKDFN